MIILGLNIFHADTSASLITNGKIISAIEEERFNKIKHYSGLPINAINYCLNSANININDVDIIAVNFNSNYNFFNKFFFALKNINFSTIEKIISIRKKLNIKNILQKNFSSKIKAKIVYVPHHISHISSSYFLSGLNDAIGLTVDGSGDFSTTESFFLKNKSITLVGKTLYPHSLGIFYQTFTQFLGFKNYGDEYKFMGLSSYGSPIYKDKVKEVIKYDDEGNFKLNLKFFTHHRESLNYQFDDGKPYFNNFFSDKFLKIFGKEVLINEKITQYHKDLASSVQKVFEEIIILKIKYLKNKYNNSNLVLSGGCFFNSILNGKIHDLNLFQNIIISPFVGDAGGGLGASLYYIRNNKYFKNVPLQNSYLGSKFSDEFIRSEIINNYNLENSNTINFKYYKIDDELNFEIAKQIYNNKIVAWFQGGSEFGPRALGNRSFFANPTNPKIQDIINEKIKKREKFRPFAPIIIEDDYKKYFYQSFPSPFMSFVFRAKERAKKEVPGVVHVDGTSRVQTINSIQNPKVYNLLCEFKKLTGTPILLNTSLNINEPINNDPNTAYETFTKSNVDILVLQNYVFFKK